VFAWLLVSASAVSADFWTPPHEVFAGNNVAAVAFDAAGNYHAAFAPTTISGHFGIEYVEQGSRQWVVRKGHVRPFVPEMAIAADADHVRIVWVDTQHRDAIWLSRNDTGSWVSSRLWQGKAFSPQVVSFGRDIGIVFRDGSDELRYFIWDPVTGPTTPQYLVSSCCHGYSMALSGDSLSIAFSTTSDVARLVTTTDRGASWSPSPVICTSCADPSIALRNGIPVVLYRGHRDAWYVYRNGSSWSAPVKVFHPGKHKDQTITNPEIVTNPFGDIAATAMRTTFVAGQEPRTDVMYRSIRPWASAEVAFGTYELGLPRLTVNGGSASILFNADCACAGGESGGEFLVKQH
jgi:hypothetical protein